VLTSHTKLKIKKNKNQWISTNPIWKQKNNCELISEKLPMFLLYYCSLIIIVVIILVGEVLYIDRKFVKSVF
jgi:hypothetical protein